MGIWDKMKSIGERTVNFVTGGMNDRKLSERITRYAKGQVEDAETLLKETQEVTGETLSELGQLRVRVYEKTVTEFVSLYEMLSNVQDSGLKDVNRTFKVDPEFAVVKDLKEVSEHVQKMLIGGGAGALGGASLALGAWGLAGAIGTASTGTAIGTLSGAVATNATLAWLGGGAASAGGMGVAGGMAVLGGIALIPTAMVAMYFGQNNAKQKLNEARNFRDQADLREEEIKTYVSQLEQVQTGANLMMSVITSLDEVVRVQNSRMREKLVSIAISSQELLGHLTLKLIDSNGSVSEDTLTYLESNAGVLANQARGT